MFFLFVMFAAFMIMADMRTRGGRFHIFFGTALILFGVLAMLDNFGVIEGRELFRAYWPALLLFWGGGMLLFGHPGQRVVGGILTITAVTVLFNQTFDWHLNIWLVIWPLVLIMFGLRIMFGGHARWGDWGDASWRADRAAWRANRAAARAQWRANRAAWRAGQCGFNPMGTTPPDRNTLDATAASTSDTPPASGADAADPGAPAEGRRPTDPSATFREFAFLGGVERRNTSQTFRGGEATAFLGGVDIDLRECRMAEGGARIDVFTMLGGVSLRIPRDWTVKSEVAAILGGFHDQSAPPVGSDVKLLTIAGQAILGGIEIKN